jgi:hypothetical protein
MKNLKTTVERLPFLPLDSLKRLLNKEVLALVVTPFANDNECIQWVSSINRLASFDRYMNAPNVGVSKIGMTLFETDDVEDKVELYFDTAKEFPSYLNEIFKPYDDPLSRILTAFNSAWKPGIEVGVLNDKKMCPGIIRRIEHEGDIGLPPHQDRIEKDTNVDNVGLLTQLAVNLYLQTPESGGELLIYPAELSQEEVDSLYTGEHDFMDTSKLPKPVVLKPQEGTMIIFRSCCVHSVNACQNVDRIAASCSIGYYGDNKPLKHWS